MSNMRKEEVEEKGREIEGKQRERVDFIHPKGQFFEIKGSNLSLTQEETRARPRR